MRASAGHILESKQVSAIRAFNRFYTARLGLLRKRHLNGEFSLTEARILYEIWTNPRLTAATLCATLRLDKGYISRLLASLMKRRLLRQSASALDSRERLLSLTSSGERKAAKLNRQSAQQIEHMLSALGAAEREAVASSLAAVRALLADRPASSLKVVRLSHVTQDALGLLQEYYESVGVLVRDSPESIREIVEDPDGGIWLAYLNGKPVGCTYLHRLSSMNSATECKRLYVKPSARGNGVAHAMLDAQEEFARSRGLKRIYLDSKDDLRVAIDLYTRRGFVPCERYNKNPQATVFMVKEIAGRSHRAAPRIHLQRGEHR